MGRVDGAGGREAPRTTLMWVEAGAGVDPGRLLSCGCAFCRRRLLESPLSVGHWASPARPRTGAGVVCSSPLTVDLPLGAE